MLLLISLSPIALGIDAALAVVGGVIGKVIRRHIENKRD